MKKRRKSREIAIQILYNFHSNNQAVDDIANEEFFEKYSDNSKKYAKILAESVIANIHELTEIIKKYSKNWDIKRIAAIDKIILQIAIYEMKNMDDVPAVVAIDEALELAKKFSTKDSSKFINGILDQYRKTLSG